MTHKTYFKIRPYRSKIYTDWVKSLNCSTCNMPADDPHHMKGYGNSGTVKADDRLTMPLCRKCHDELHHHGEKTFDLKHRRMRQPAQVFHVNLTLGKAIVKGLLTRAEVDEARGLIKQ